MLWVAIYLYITAVGFVAAGLLASFVQLGSGEPMRFRIEPDTVLASIGGVLLRVLAVPRSSCATPGAGWWLSGARWAGSGLPWQS